MKTVLWRILFGWIHESHWTIDRNEAIKKNWKMIRKLRLPK